MALYLILQPQTVVFSENAIKINSNKQQKTNKMWKRHKTDNNSPLIFDFNEGSICIMSVIIDFVN